MSQPYCTASEVKNKAVEAAVQQAGWSDTEVGYRILESDTIIDSALAGLGYGLPFTTNPPLVKILSIIHSRYCVLRDAYKNAAPSLAGAEGFKSYQEQFDGLLEKLTKGELRLLDNNGSEIGKVSNRVLNAAEPVGRVLPIVEPARLGLALDPEYNTPEVSGATDFNGGSNASTNGFGPSDD